MGGFVPTIIPMLSSLQPDSSTQHGTISLISSMVAPVLMHRFHCPHCFGDQLGVIAQVSRGASGGPRWWGCLGYNPLFRPLPPFGVVVEVVDESVDVFGVKVVGVVDDELEYLVVRILHYLPPHPLPVVVGVGVVFVQSYVTGVRTFPGSHPKVFMPLMAPALTCVSPAGWLGIKWLSSRG